MNIPGLPDYAFLHRLEALPFVDAVWLYGSRARGDNFARADIDLAVLCPHASREDWRQVLDLVEEADTLLHIDCVRFDTLQIHDELRDSIVTDHVELFHRPGVLTSESSHGQ